MSLFESHKHRVEWLERMHAAKGSNVRWAESEIAETKRKVLSSVGDEDAKLLTEKIAALKDRLESERVAEAKYVEEVRQAQDAWIKAEEEVRLVRRIQATLHRPAEHDKRDKTMDN